MLKLDTLNRKYIKKSGSFLKLFICSGIQIEVQIILFNIVYIEMIATNPHVQIPAV